VPFFRSRRSVFVIATRLQSGELRNLLTRRITHTSEVAGKVSSHRLQLKSKKGIQDTVKLMDGGNLHYNEEPVHFV
jgi:predicted acyltransferase (DUF342 family)